VGGVRPDVRSWGARIARPSRWRSATLGRNGQDTHDPADKYRLKALPGSFSGLYLLASIRTAFRQIDPR
jgi:hypothetical protein